MPTADNSGIKINYEVTGTGPPVSWTSGVGLAMWRY